MDNKIDLILQGPYTKFTDTIIDSYSTLSFINHIIVSCWESDPQDNSSNSKVKFVRSPKYESYPGPTNVNLQLTTSLAGVKYSNSNYIAKFRTDQLYTLDSLKRMYDYFISNFNSEKIYVCGDIYQYLFHPRDWVYWGCKESMINLFDIPHEKNYVCEKLGINSKNYSYSMHLLTRPETYIAAYYCSRFDDRVKIMLDNQDKYLYDGSVEWTKSHSISKEVMKKAFKSFPREGIEMIWPRKNILQYCFPFDQGNEGWDEEGC